MRHLFLMSRGSSPLRIATVGHLGFAAALLIAATPALAQKPSAAKTKAAKAAGSPAVRGQANEPTRIASDTSLQAAEAGADLYDVTTGTPLRAAPDAATTGDLLKTSTVQVIARDRGWTRVRVEGWVPDSVLVPADTTYRAGLSAADLRANPQAARGKTVMWSVEFLALETADPLRHGLVDGEPYILARGPGSENALLYLVVPPSLMGTARALQPLARITVVARVRDGRSDPVGIPILDIQNLHRNR